MLVTSVLQRLDVRLLVLGGEFHLLAESTLDLATERVDLALGTLHGLSTSLLVTTHLRLLHQLLRLHTAFIDSRLGTNDE